MEKSTKTYNKSSVGRKKYASGEKKSFDKDGKRSYRSDRKPFAKSDRQFHSDNKFSQNSDKTFRSDKKRFDEAKASSRKTKDFSHKPQNNSHGADRFSDKSNTAYNKNISTRNKASFDEKQNGFSKRNTGFRNNKPVRNAFADSNKDFTAKAEKNDIIDSRIEIALQSLIDVEKNGKYINLAFKHNDKLDKLEKKDRAYVMRILYGVTEKSYTLNWILQKVLKEKRVKPWLNAILRIGTYQIFYMRIEDKDAIEQASELCKKYVSDELCGFVTAVLSKLSENKDEYNPELYKFKTTAERLSVVYSYPEWLIDMWIKDYGIDTVNSLLENKQQRSINLRVSANASKAEIMTSLFDAGIKCSDGVLYNTISISDTVNIEALDCYRNGLVTAQGIGSMLTVDVLNVRKNSSVLDACAAPGGKTFYIAEKTDAEVQSCDIHEHRVELIKKGVERLKLENVNVACRDMSIPHEEYVDSFDRVLIDAPCSGLGMINSKPDIKNNAAPEEIKDLSEIQAKLLDTCSAYVKAGGIIVYSTCTVSKAENEQNISNFLEKHNNFELVEIDSNIPDMLNYILDSKTVTILPSQYNSDAFFIAAMRRCQ